MHAGMFSLAMQQLANSKTRTARALQMHVSHVADRGERMRGISRVTLYDDAPAKLAVTARNETAKR
jgi:hypothetical protein